MKRTKSYVTNGGRDSRNRRYSRAALSSLPISKLLFGVIALFLVVVLRDRWRGKAGELTQRPQVSMDQPAPVPNSAFSVPAGMAKPNLARLERQELSVSNLRINESATALEKPQPDAESTAAEKSETTVKYVMEMNRSNSFMGLGSINGKVVTLLADTGATHVVVPEKIAERIGLRRGPPMQFKTGGGHVVHYATTLDTLRMGQIEIQKVEAAINPAMQEDFVLLGMSALSLLEMQLESGKLVLKHKVTKAFEGAKDGLASPEPFKRAIKDCVKGNQFDNATLDCLKGH